MKIKTNTPLKTLAGEELKGTDGVLTIGRALAEILLTDQTAGKMKAYVLAQKLYNDKEVEIDNADLTMIKKAVETSKAYGSALVTGQLLVMLEELK